MVTCHPRQPRPTTDQCQHPNAEKHHTDKARHRHPPPWRSVPPRAHHVATPTTGIATANHVLSGFCHRPTLNTVIPTVRTTMPLCRGPHRSRRHRQPPPRDTLLSKRTPELRITDHHDTDQSSATTEDAIHAMEPPAPDNRGGGGRPIPAPCATERRRPDTTGPRSHEGGGRASPPPS
jgi:hypothetical protein